MERNSKYFGEEVEKMQQESQGNLEAKVRKQRAIPSSVLKVFPLPLHLFIGLGARSRAKNHKTLNFYTDIQENLFDFSSPSMLPF